MKQCRTTWILSFGLALLFFTAPLYAQQKKWKNYVKGPGVTFVTSTQDPQAHLIINGPPLQQTDHMPITIPFSFTYQLDPDFETLSSISYSYKCKRADLECGSGAGNDSQPNNPPEIYQSSFTLSDTLPGEQEVFHYSLDLTLTLNQGTKITTIAGSCSFDLIHTGSPPPCVHNCLGSQFKWKNLGR